MKFYYSDIEIEIPESVYCPREDSELMAKAVESTDVRGEKVLEVGCGSGFLSILAAKKGAEVTAVDINPDAVDATKANAEANNVNVHTSQSDLFSSVHEKFDLIVFNPPYLPVEEGETDKTYAGGRTGRDVVEKFVSEVKNHLNPKGHVLLLISSLTGEKEVLDLFIKEGFRAEPIMREKIPWEELIVIKALMH